MQVAQLFGRVGLDTDDVKRGAREAHGLLDGLKSTFLTLGTQAAASAAGFLIRDVVVSSWNRLTGAVRDTSRELVGANRTWEQFETRFATQLKSTEAAQKRLSELEQFGILTPFDLGAVIEADIIMQNFGLHAEDSARRFGKSGDEIRRIAGDTAAGVGAGFTEISMWLGRFAAGDTGQAIMRMQELGVTTRQELAAMDVEFNKAGSLVSPVDDAMTALLQIMDRKFGGLMDVQSRTLTGMESNLGDWMDRQKRLWGEPVTDAYKDHLGDLVGFLDSELVTDLSEAGRELFSSAVGWLDDVAIEWAHKLGGLAVDAFNWGANVVRQFAAGIEGSGYVADALSRIADDIAYWLMPGSPPRLLPDLPEWGKGALEAYLSGWEGVQTGEVQSYLADALKSLEPFLRDGIFTDAERAQMQEAFGGRAGVFEGYVTEQAKLRTAVSETAAARLALTDAEQSGDADAIAAARERLALAETEEQQANDRVRAEERRVAEHLEAERAFLRAIQQQTDAVGERDRREAQAHTDAEARAAEAEQRAIQQARLRWELAVAETPGGQLSIWERELAAAQEGSAEWYDISTRIVQLQQRIRDGMAAGGSGGSLASGLLTPPTEQEVEQFWNDSGAYVEQGMPKVDWLGIGQAIGGKIISGLASKAREKLDEWAGNLASWAMEPGTQQKAAEAGAAMGQMVASTVAAMFRVDKGDEGFLTGIPEDVRYMLEQSGVIVEENKPSLTGAFGSLALSVVGAFGEAWDTEWATRETTMTEAVGKLGEQMVSSMWNGWEQEWAERGGLAGFLAKALGAQGQIEGVLAAHTDDPNWFEKIMRDYGEWWGNLPPGIRGYANGTLSAPGGWAMVGEQGPELVSLPRGSQVLPASDTARAMGQQITIAPGAIVINAPNGDAREIEIGVMRGLRAAGVY